MKRMFCAATASLFSIMSSPVLADEPIFLTYYPACDYKVLDTNTVTQMSYIRRMVISDEERDALLADAKDELYFDARRQGVWGIALKKISFERRDMQSTLIQFRVSAEYISQCENGEYERGEVTRYTPEGFRQYDMNITTERKRMVFTAAEQEDKSPALMDDKAISIENGIYGVNIGDSKQTVFDVYGTPTFEYQVNTDWTLQSYGRTHWLVYHNDTLAEIRYGSEVFGNELTNFLPFDDRFDYAEWSVAGYSINDTVDDENVLRQVKGSTELLMLNDTYLVNNQKSKRHEVTGFQLRNKAVMNQFPGLSLTANSDMLVFLQNFIDNKGDKILQVSDLPGEPLGSTKVMFGKRYVLVSPNILVQAVGDNVSKVFVSPDYFQKPYTVKNDWKFAAYYNSQPMKEALAEAGEGAFLMHDMVEVTKDTHLVKVFFAEQNGTKQAYGMEIQLF